MRKDYTFPNNADATIQASWFDTEGTSAFVLVAAWFAIKRLATDPDPALVALDWSDMDYDTQTDELTVVVPVATMADLEPAVYRYDLVVRRDDDDRMQALRFGTFEVTQGIATIS